VTALDGSAPAYAQVRAIAASCVHRVATEGRYLDNALTAARAQHHRLSAADLAMLQELTYGSLRWHRQLAAIVDRLLHRPLATKDADLHALLIVGLYQLRQQQVVDALAVDATVEATAVLGKPWAKGMVNACLRRAQREQPSLDAWVARDPERQFSHPRWLIEALRNAYPANWQAILNANNARPPLTLRMNVQRTTVAGYLAMLHADGSLRGRCVEAVPTALVVEPPVSVERLPGFRQGRVSVQDAAAQLAAMLLDAQAGERVLDACAAPGGKTGHLGEYTPALAELVAIDNDTQRLAPLRENLERLGLHATVRVADATDPESWWDGRPFDRILLDAPCSATGVIRRHPDIKVRRRASDLPRLCDMQARLLAALWPLLRPGGKLLYVTCSVLPAENHDAIQAFLQQHDDARSERPLVAVGHWTGTGLQIVPGEQEMDGFFYALLSKH